MKLGNPLKAITLLACASFALVNSYSQTTVLQYRSIWKYWDQNSRPMGWETTGFNDAGWASDSAELGYSTNELDEATVISYGPNASDKYRTAYFRRSVNIPNPGAFSSFTFGVERDDGCVIYVNGVEVARSNMPGGAIDHNTFANGPAVDDSTIIITVPTSVFVSGTNVIAVEMHQVNATSSDLSFDLELIGNASPGIIIPFNSSWRYLDINNRPSNWQTQNFFDGAWRLGYGELGAGDLDEATVINIGPGGARYWTTYFRKRIYIANPAAFANYWFSVERDDGYVLYINGVERSRDNMATGTVTHTLKAAVNVEDSIINFILPNSVFVAGYNTISVEVHQENQNSSDLSFNLQAMGIGATTTLAPYNGNWKYLANNTYTAGWNTTGFDDAAWPSGNGEFGFGDGDETTCIPYGCNGDVCNPTTNCTKYITSLFRKVVDIPNLSQFVGLTLNLVRDDGAVVYVNGVPVVRSNMPTTGNITQATLASSNVGGGAESQVNTYFIASSYFVPGNNTIAVEIHQDAATSSDLSFRLELIGNGLPGSISFLMNYGEVWKYLDNGTDQGTAWQGQPLLMPHGQAGLLNWVMAMVTKRQL